MTPPIRSHSSTPGVRRARATIAAVALGIVLLAVAGLVFLRLFGEAEAPVRGAGAPAPVAVEVAPVRTETLRVRRAFTGSLAPSAEVAVAPKITGRVVERPVDLADPVSRGDLIARLDSAEATELVTQQEADLALADARAERARTSAELSARELERVEQLHAWGDASESELDTARAAQAASAAEVRVAQAERSRAAAVLEAARIRLSYTEIRADWPGGADTRVIAGLGAEIGDLVTPAGAIATVVELDPAEAVLFVTESDYAAMRAGLSVTVSTDAFPGRTWTGEVARVAPVFREGSRQARVEVRVPNPDWALKPGMFVRVETVLSVIEGATVVPASAIVERGDGHGVFLVSEDRSAVRLVPVQLGVRDGELQQVIGEGLAGEAVTLGQHLLDDGSAIRVPTAGDPE
jgi:RND family efflux transporter MFP subunit